MFEVKGIPILVDELEILYKLRDDVYERTGRELFHKIKKSGDNIMVCCPEHKNGQERTPSCGISLKRIKDKPPGFFHCFTCGYVDSLEGAVSKCFGHYEDNSYGINWLIENFVSFDETIGRPELVLDYSRETIIKPDIKYVTEEELAKYRFYHPYMYQRKLTNEVIEKYDVGYQNDYVVYEKDGYKKIDQVLTFPVKDIDGNCLFISRRSVNSKNFYLPKLDKPVYGLYELPKNCSEVIICESVINALTCVVYGRPAVALFGTGTKYEYEQLKKLPVRKFIIGLDPDEAGDKGTYRLKNALKGRMVTKLVLPPKKDINDLTYEEFWSLPEIYI